MWNRVCFGILIRNACLFAFVSPPRLQLSYSEHRLSLKGKELPTFGAEINTDSSTTGISLFKKILLTPDFIGGSCRLNASAKPPYI